MNMGVSQRLSMHITSLIGIAFKHNEHKNNNAKISLLMHKQNKELEIVTKTNRTSL